MACHLNQGSYNVNEVAIQLGYSNSSHFIEAFKKKFGTTPKKYLLSRPCARASLTTARLNDLVLPTRLDFGGFLSDLKNYYNKINPNA